MDSVGSRWPIPHDEQFEVLRVLRLDDVPEVSREANLNHLENPDFLLVGVRESDSQAILQAVDAKFAPDRIKPSQVSVEAVNNLLALGGAVHTIVEEALASSGLSNPHIVRGVFVAPESALTTHLLRRVTTGRNPSVDPAEVVAIPPDTGTLFAGLPESRIIGHLARIDALPVSPRDNLTSAIYYFRLACACFYLWSEEYRPLLTSQPATDPETGIVAAEVTLRVAEAESAYQLVEQWATDVEPQVRAREAISNVATLPVRMRDIRSQVDQAGLGGDNRALRAVRRDLELAFRERLAALTGEISANDPRPLTQILDDVAKAARSLTGDMQALMHERIAALRANPPASSDEP
jgi:hypothetical protein